MDAVTARAGRVLGVDLGARRIGLAVSDPSRSVASPHAVLARTGDRRADHRAIVAAAHEIGATTIVVGMPLSLSGRAGPAARAVREEVDALQAEAGAQIDVVVQDERLTTVVAERALATGGVRPRARRGLVDKVAAAVMLQSWLDRSAGSS